MTITDQVLRYLAEHAEVAEASPSRRALAITVADAITAASGRPVELVEIVTTGDTATAPLSAGALNARISGTVLPERPARSTATVKSK